jgi:hypothetical protein
VTAAVVAVSLLGVLLAGALLGVLVWVVAVALLGYVVISRPLTPRVWLLSATGLLVSTGAYVILAVAVGVLTTSPVPLP